MKIKPLIGIDNIHFGLSKEQVKELLGPPKSSETSKWPDDTTTECWLYPGLQIELDFDSEDNFKLTTISVFYKEAKLDGIAFIGLSEKELKGHLPEIILEDDFEENGRDYWLSKKEISFWVNDGIVNCLTLFPKYDDSGQNIIWPKKTS